MMKLLTTLKFLGILGAILILPLQAQLARAEADGPDYWAVQGVAANDVLNMRTRPSAKGKKLGEIPPDGRGIRNLGCVGEISFEEYQRLSEAQREKKKHQRWCKVEYQGTTGYVNGVFLKEDSGPARSK